MNIPRKRSGSNSKRTKEKFEIIFKNEESEELNENLFDEILSSVINVENFETEIMKIVNIEQSAVVKKNLNLFFKHCINTIDLGKKFII